MYHGSPFSVKMVIDARSERVGIQANSKAAAHTQWGAQTTVEVYSDLVSEHAVTRNMGAVQRPASFYYANVTTHTAEQEMFT